MTVSQTALILAGHGSHISPNTAGIVWHYVDALRTLGVADEITAAFWKELPSFHTVFRTLLATDITIVPMFTANGYFTETVIPAEMGLTGAITRRDGLTIRYTRPIGEHPIIGQIVEQRARDALAQYALDPTQTCLAIIGHSTRRNPRSRQATEAQADHLRALNIAAEVRAIYLDDDPEIPTIYSTTQQHNIVAIPYFLAAGSHTTIDVPTELGIGAGQTTGMVEGHSVYYTPPIGTGTELLPAILDLAREAGAALHEPRANGSAWDCFPQAGRTEMIEWLDRLETTRQRIASMTFEDGQWNPDDIFLSFGELKALRHDVYMADDDNPILPLYSPADLRSHLREKSFRPVATLKPLPRGWIFKANSNEQICAVIDLVYPGILAEWASNRQAGYQSNSLDGVLGRQTGMYKKLSQLSNAQIGSVGQHTCNHCVCLPYWYWSGDEDQLLDTLRLGKSRKLPCYEPCNYWLSKALTLLEETGKEG
jgi:sirohydrochlorin cobaltochelatase